MAEGTPTGRHRPLTRDPRVRKRLFSPAAKSESSATNEVTVDVWSDDENKALVEFVLLHCAPETWPSHGKASRFWREAAELNLYQGEVKLYISEQLELADLGLSLSTQRNSTLHWMPRSISLVHPSTGAAEEVPMEMHISCDATTQTDEPLRDATPRTYEPLRDATTQTDEPLHSIFASQLEKLSDAEQLDVIGLIFQKFAETKYGVDIYQDFVHFTVLASLHLKQCGRSNVVYELAKAVGRMRPEGSDSRLPAKRMPMGLLEHMVHFFNANTYQKIGPCPADYRLWLSTMYCQFGNKWCNLHLGPMWSVAHTEQSGYVCSETLSSDPLRARVNIPGVSSRTIRKLVAECPVTTTANIQTYVLDEAAKCHPDAWWWLKADGCDLVPGLSESTKGVWSGDVDLNSGDLETEYKKYQHKGFRTLMDMLTPIVTSDGSVIAKRINPVVPIQLLQEIHSWRLEGASDNDVITRLRQRTVPLGFTCHPWCAGKTETPLEQLKSILSQLHYSHDIVEWEKKGVPFRSHVYVPENHPITGVPFHEREDEAHVFKRIAQSLRDGGPQELKLERFMEAVYDDDAKLSYHALVGTRRQSVSDVEQIFSSRVLKFLESKGYETEVQYVKVIRNRRRACDERGLTDMERSMYNQEFLSYILDELMPWHSNSGLHDFSLLEVNQSVNGVRGFTRETLSALLVNIESREWRRRFNTENNIPPEHPRASTSDDVECFFSVLRDMIGKDFTLKEVMFGWRKACEELIKRVDPELPYFYHTSSHQRFFEGDRPDFSMAADKPQKEHIYRRELLSGKIGGRVSMAQHKATSIRTKYHNVPVELLPPPSMPVHVTDHAYSKH